MRTLNLTVLAVLGLGFAAPSFSQPAATPAPDTKREEAYDARSEALRASNKAAYARKEAAAAQMHAKREEGYDARSEALRASNKAAYARKEAAAAQMREKRGEAYRAREVTQRREEKAEYRSGMKDDVPAKPDPR